MQKTIKELQAQWLSKNLIYEALKTVLPFSKQFLKNKRIFNEKDIEMFENCKQFGIEKTVLKYSSNETIENNKTVLNSFKPDIINNKNSLKEEFKTVKKQFEDREEEYKQLITQKDKIIQVKNEQTQKYALLKQEEKKEKEEWIKKYDEIQKEKNKWIQKYYSTKMYMIVFLILLILASIFLWLFFIK